MDPEPPPLAVVARLSPDKHHPKSGTTKEAAMARTNRQRRKTTLYLNANDRAAIKRIRSRNMLGTDAAAVRHAIASQDRAESRKPPSPTGMAALVAESLDLMEELAVLPHLAHPKQQRTIRNLRRRWRTMST